MKSKTLCLLTVSFLSVTLAFGQKGKQEAVEHEKEIKDMIAFFQYMLNTLGDASTPNRDKDVLVKESYSKVFRDSKVQIEDDLDENRFVATNKDVQAYLKDVDFFFKNVKFEFTVDDIKKNGSEAEKLWYVATVTRNLKGTTSDGKPVNNTIKRFIEINFNPVDEDLRIVSIYTNPINEKKALTAWWEDLSYEWKAHFQRKLNLSDSVSLTDIKAVTAIDTLDISRNFYIQNLNPLSQLLDLKVLYVSGTNINDLAPIRNLTNLVVLHVAGTKVSDINALRYCANLQSLDLSGTLVDSIDVVQGLTGLKYLSLEGTPVKDFTPLAHLTALQSLNVSATALGNLQPIDSLVNLTELNVSKTPVNNISELASLTNLAILNLDSTGFTDATPLSYLRNLKVLSVNHTALQDLQPLAELIKLQRIYCDHTGVNQEMANAYMAHHPDALVVFDSEDLRVWWEDLPMIWRDVLSRMARVSYNPSKEELVLVTKVDSVNLSNFTGIKNLQPIRRLTDLHVLIAANTGINDLSYLAQHKNLRLLDISKTNVTELSQAASLTNLKVLKAENMSISSLDTIAHLKLNKLYVDGTDVKEESVKALLMRNPSCLVIYKTPELEEWWTALPETWKQIFRMQLKMDNKLTRERLHELTQLTRLQFNEVAVDNLDALNQFISLKTLAFSQTSISDLSPLATLATLKSLQVNDNPIRNLEALRSLRVLEDLNISNTPVSDLEVIGGIKSLKKLNCSGTRIKKLNPLKETKMLEQLDCSNTDVRKLTPLEQLPLTILKCYNTKVSKSEVARFQKKNPDCNITYYR